MIPTEVDAVRAEDFADWIGRRQARREVILDQPVLRLARIFDMDRPPAPDGRVPEGWHWLSFLPEARARDLGPDGHPGRGGFMPPIPWPRRMFGGASARFPAPLLTGVEADLTEEITGVELKSGGTGPLAFVTVARRIAQAGEMRVDETQTIIYRPAATGPTAGAPRAPTDRRDAEWRVEHRPGPVDLFRFSAVTFNAHRIHYDRDYATREEGYPGLVIHGPYTALTLLEEARSRWPGARVTRFDFRPTAPLFESGGFAACGRRSGDKAELWAETPEGATAMTATARFAAEGG